MTRVCSCENTASSSRPVRNHVHPAWHAGFVRLLPAIRRHAQVCLRHLPAAAREEALAEVVANAVLAYVRLDSLGKADLAYPTVLAQYAVGRYRDGRRVGSRSNANDVMSGRCLRFKDVVVGPLEKLDDRTGRWREILLEDRTAGPAETAATRLDFAEWLNTLSARDRRLAETLALGETTGRVARMFQISAARVSQLRREFCESWHQFVGELADASGPSVATA